MSPSPGTTVLHCGHPETARRWWHLNEPQAFEEVESKWVTACEPCYLLASGQPERVQVAGTGSWE